MARRGDGLYQRGKSKTWWLEFVHDGRRQFVGLGKGITRTVAREIAQVKRTVAREIAQVKRTVAREIAQVKRTVAREIAQVKRASILKGEAGIGRKRLEIGFDHTKEAFLQWAEAHKRPRTAGTAPGRESGGDITPLGKPRSERPGEGDALVRLIREADDLGFLSKHSLDDLLDLTDPWLERDALRAKLMESYPAAAAFAVAFVPAERWVGEGGYVVAPIIYGTEKIPTVLCALPEETIRALRDLPPGAGRVAALFEKPRQYLDDDNERRR